MKERDFHILVILLLAMILGSMVLAFAYYREVYIEGEVSCYLSLTRAEDVDNIDEIVLPIHDSCENLKTWCWTKSSNFNYTLLDIRCKWSDLQLDIYTGGCKCKI